MAHMDMDGGIHGMDGMHDMDGMVNMDGMDHDMHGTDMASGMDMHGTHGMDMMGGMHGMHMMGNSSMHMMMMMYFHFSQNIPHLLFESWNISAVGELVGAVVFTVVLAVLYEGLKTVREYLMCVGLQKSQAKDAHHQMTMPETAPEKKGDIESPHSHCSSQPPNPTKKWHALKHYSISMTMHIIQSLLHIIQVGVAYLLMLIAMTYNVWLFLGVIFGSGLGYFIFAKVRHLSSPFREQQDHCH